MLSTKRPEYHQFLSHLSALLQGIICLKHYSKFESRGEAFAFGAILGGLAGGIIGIIVVAEKAVRPAHTNRLVDYSMGLTPVRVEPFSVISAPSIRLTINH